eukprot:jgi/Ulvmu1/35/UM001_0037.1
MARDVDFRTFVIKDTPEPHVLTAAINVCRLERVRATMAAVSALLWKTAFAMEDCLAPWPDGSGGICVTLLHDFLSTTLHVPYVAAQAVDPAVYSIEGCL